MGGLGCGAAALQPALAARSSPATHRFALLPQGVTAPASSLQATTWRIDTGLTRWLDSINCLSRRRLGRRGLRVGHAFMGPFP